MKRFTTLLLLCIFLLAGCGSKAGLATMAHFEAIEVGMTYKEVCDIIGSDGELIAEAGSGDLTLQSYSWEGEKAGASISISFTNGVVGAKAQSGLA